MKTNNVKSFLLVISSVFLLINVVGCTKQPTVELMEPIIEEDEAEEHTEQNENSEELSEEEKEYWGDIEKPSEEEIENENNVTETP